MPWNYCKQCGAETPYSLYCSKPCQDKHSAHLVAIRDKIDADAFRRSAPTREAH